MQQVRMNLEAAHNSLNLKQSSKLAATSAAHGAIGKDSVTESDTEPESDQKVAQLVHPKVKEPVGSSTSRLGGQSCYRDELAPSSQSESPLFMTPKSVSSVYYI